MILLHLIEKDYGKTKLFALKLHFIRKFVERVELELKYLQTDLMIADFLTKGLGKTKHARFCAALLGHTNPKGGVKEVKNDFR